MSETEDQSYVANAKLRQGRTVGRTLYLQRGDEPSDDDQLVGMVDDPALAAYLCEARNTYVDAMQRLAALPHPDAIPGSWRDDPQNRLLSLTDVVDLVCQHIAPNTLGAPEDAL